MSYNVRPLISHTVSDIRFLPDGQVFYRDNLAKSTTLHIGRSGQGHAGAGLR